MGANIVPGHNVIAVVPLLMIATMERSLVFYIGGLGFTIQNRWAPDGHLRGCRMSLGGAPLQESTSSTGWKIADGIRGNGAALCFQCSNALAIYGEAAVRGISATREPQVGNFACEVFFADPDGYKINFSGPTNWSEETLLSGIERIL
jgi:catechol 2,3-dioxygenase-like lactoylglutathione lyase family enzyme